MKISLNWLKRYVHFEESAESVAKVLPMLGIEVESVTHTGMDPIEHVVVGEVLSREPHPNADKLSVCKVKVNDGVPLQIVCGANNYKAGDRVPVALPGAKMPAGFKIKASKLRGVESEGMLCSASELGRASDEDGLWVLKNNPDIGLPIHCIDTDRDTIFDVELTANRGDCLSHIGIARELAAHYNLPLQLPKMPAITTSTGTFSVHLETKACRLYTLHAVSGVQVGPSPEWLQQDLRKAGLRPINNIVDVTNWVMLETGQPLHAFDVKKVVGATLHICQGRTGPITLLNGQTCQLHSEDIVIADEQKPIVLAGIMGSIEAEVDVQTTDILLESAYFHPGTIRNSCKRHAIASDSGYRFMRDVDPAGVAFAAQRALSLLSEIAGGVRGQAIVAGSAPRGDVTIALDPALIDTVLGISVDKTLAASLLVRLGFAVNSNNVPWSVTVPSFRSDIQRPIDLVEECLRLYGTDKLPASRVSLQAIHQEEAPLSRFTNRSAQWLADKGFVECYNYSLTQAESLSTTATALVLNNPLTSEMTHVRDSLLPGLVEAFRFNLRNGNTPYGLFETGRVFRQIDDQVLELLSVAFVAPQKSIERHWAPDNEVDFFFIKALAIELAQLNDISLGHFSTETSPLWQPQHAAKCGDIRRGYALSLGTLNLEKTFDIPKTLLGCECLLLPSSIVAPKPYAYKKFSAFPRSTKDIAVIVDASVPADVVAADIEKIARKVQGFSLEKITLFDVYNKEDQKSLAFSLAFRSPERTLKDDEVNAAFQKIQSDIEATTNYKIRKE